MVVDHAAEDQKQVRTISLSDKYNINLLPLIRLIRDGEGKRGGGGGLGILIIISTD